MGLHTKDRRLDLTARQTFMVIVDLLLQLVQQSLQIDEVSLLWYEHSVETLHVVRIKRYRGRVVVAKYARRQCPGRLSLRLNGGCRIRFAAVGRLGCLGGALGIRRLRVRRALDGGWPLLISREFCAVEAFHDLVELLLGSGVDGVAANGDGVAQGEGRADNRGGLIVRAPARRRNLELVLLTEKVVLVGILAVEGLPAGFAGSLKVGLVRFGGRGGTGLEDLLGEDVGRNGRK